MEDELIIRPATRADIPEIFRLYEQLSWAYSPQQDHYEYPDSTRLWEEVSKDSRQHVMAAELAGRIIGTLTFIIIPNLGHQGKPWAAIENLVVDGEYRGKGIGKSLMQYAGDLARVVGCYKMILSSNLLRPEAHEFYRSLGWRWTHVGFSLDIEDY